MLVPPPMILCLLHMCCWPHMFFILSCACPLGAVATWSSSSRGWWLPVTRALHRPTSGTLDPGRGLVLLLHHLGWPAPLGQPRAALPLLASAGLCGDCPEGIQLGLPGVGEGSRPGLLDSVHSVPSWGLSLVCQQCRSPRVSLEASRAGRPSVLLSCSVGSRLRQASHGGQRPCRASALVTVLGPLCWCGLGKRGCL